MSNKLLIQESPLIVLPQLAVKIGLNEAIFLQQLHFWLTPTPKYKPHYRKWEGKTLPWIYNTYDEKSVGDNDDTTGWKSNFPFWSIPTLKRIVKSLKDKNLIITTDDFNASTANRTLWYTINYDELNKLETSDTLDSIKLIPPSYQNDTLREDQFDTLMTETTTEITTERGDAPKKNGAVDYLDTVVGSIGKVSEQTAENPEDQYWVYRDKFINTYSNLTGDHPDKVKKDAIIELVQSPLADLAKWERSIRVCMLNYTGRGIPPMARIIEVYNINGNYEAWRQQTYGGQPDNYNQVQTESKERYILVNVATGEKTPIARKVLDDNSTS